MKTIIYLILWGLLLFDLLSPGGLEAVLGA